MKIYTEQEEREKCRTVPLSWGGRELHVSAENGIATRSSIPRFRHASTKATQPRYRIEGVSLYRSTVSGM